MSETSYKLRVWFQRANNRDSSGNVHFSNRKNHRPFLDIEGVSISRNDVEYRIFEYQGSYDSEIMQSVRQILLDSGLKEWTDGIMPLDKGHTHFQFAKEVTYSKEEIENAELLQLIYPSTIQRISNYLCWSKAPRGELLIDIDAQQKNKIFLGWAGGHDLLVSEIGKENFFNESIYPELTFEKLGCLQPEKLTKPLYKVGSKIKMPPCLTKLVEDDYSIGNEYYKGDRFEHDYFSDNTLRFPRNAVKKLPDFDIAVTQEQIHNYNDTRAHHYIVTQQFRKYMKKIKVKAIDYIPVTLVD